MALGLLWWFWPLCCKVVSEVNPWIHMHSIYIIQNYSTKKVPEDFIFGTVRVMATSNIGWVYNSAHCSRHGEYIVPPSGRYRQKSTLVHSISEVKGGSLRLQCGACLLGSKSQKAKWNLLLSKYAKNCTVFQTWTLGRCLNSMPRFKTSWIVALFLVNFSKHLSSLLIKVELMQWSDGGSVHTVLSPIPYLGLS